MFHVPKQVHPFDGKLKYVESCPNQPVPLMAFCQEHCEEARKLGLPTNLREFLHYHKTGNINAQMAPENSHRTAADCQGLNSFLQKHPELPAVIDYADEEPHTQTKCNKDTGTQKRIQKWTRGHLFVVRGGGHIDMWQPLYQSEGPAQVFLIVLVWLLSALGHLPRHVWQKKIIAYDNMCHLDNLTVAKKPLPLPGMQKHIWTDVRKVIDCLHIRNHKDERCRVRYNPENIKKEYPDMNTICCEQTFAWLSRYKRILGAMPKTHHHFYLHRMVKRRNHYIGFCYEHGRRPVQPNIKPPKEPVCTI